MGGLLNRMIERITAKKRRGSGKDFIRNVAILSDLTEEELDQVYAIVRPLEVPKGRVIMQEGEIGDSMYFFAQGVADVTKSLTIKLGQAEFGSVEKSMVKLDSRFVSFFGDMAMFQDEPRSATITAASDCLLYEIKRDDFQVLVDRSPALGVKILRKIASALCHRIRKGNQDILKLSTALSMALSK